MLLSLLKQSFKNQKRAMALMVVSVAMGTAVSASLITISLDIKGKVAEELRSFGANITLEPHVEGVAELAGQRRHLREEDIVKAKTIFWRHNIVGLAPFLEVHVNVSGRNKQDDVVAAGTWFERVLPMPGEDEGFPVGIFTVSPWWDLRGRAPAAGEAVVGVSLARRLDVRIGDGVTIEGERFRITGLLSSGGPEDDRAFLDLDELQRLVALPGAVSRIMVSALTTPMDDFAYKDPETMSTTEYEKWYCTGYVTSIAKQLEEVFAGSRAKPIWQVAQTEGTVLERLSILVYLLTIAALLASAIGMSTTMAASLLRRLDEIGLMKSVGADSVRITGIFLAEAFIIGVAGGVAGYLLSALITAFIGAKVFGASLAGRKVLLFFISFLSALGIAALASLLPIRRALAVKPAVVLKGGQ